METYWSWGCHLKHYGITYTTEFFFRHISNRLCCKQKKKNEMQEQPKIHWSQTTSTTLNREPDGIEQNSIWLSVSSDSNTMEKMQVIKPSVSEGKLYTGQHIKSIYIASYINFKKEYKQTTCTSIQDIYIYIMYSL